MPSAVLKGRKEGRKGKESVVQREAKELVFLETKHPYVIQLKSRTPFSPNEKSCRVVGKNTLL